MWEKIVRLSKRWEVNLFLKLVGAHILVFTILTITMYGISFIVGVFNGESTVKDRPTNEAVRTLEIELRGDSIKIDNIIKEYEKEIKNANNLDDSASVKLFIKLVQAE